MEDIARRKVLSGILCTAAVGCVPKKSDWCEAPEITEDGAFPGPDMCQTTASNIEGPYYLSDAPERSDLNIFGDTGTTLSITGKVFSAGCSAGIAGAIVEFWHADPDGDYDNSSSDMRYRCRIQTDDIGSYSLQTLLPGRYLNQGTYRPRHIHVKVFDGEGVERLTTQLYFKGDPYIECDGFANRSLVVPFSGEVGSSMTAVDVNLVLG
jgi:protocatechuate 3,4-dioxygenase beta subunit